MSPLSAQLRQLLKGDLSPRMISFYLGESGCAHGSRACVESVWADDPVVGSTAENWCRCWWAAVQKATRHCCPTRVTIWPFSDGVQAWMSFWMFTRWVPQHLAMDIGLQHPILTSNDNGAELGLGTPDWEQQNCWLYMVQAVHLD